MTVWATGRYDLRLSEKEFWQTTPVQFNALLLRKQEADNQADLRTAQIVCILANIYRKKGSRQFRPQDFMPGLVATKPARPRRQTPEEILAVAKRITLLLGGKVSSRLM